MDLNKSTFTFSLLDTCVEDLTKVLLNHRTTLSKNLADTKMERAKMLDMQWRINISLTST